jgi:transposase
MKLCRTCKQYYAALSAGPFHGVAIYCIYSMSFCKMQEIMLDIPSKCGIIILTHKAATKEVPMAKSPRTDSKEKALRDCGAWNRHPVTDSLFSDNDFFDSRDLVQVKYEMLRRVHKEGESVSRAAASFGFSRPSFYKSLGEFEREGVPGLLPRKRGPRGAHKLTVEVVAFVAEFSASEQPVSIPALMDEVDKRFGIRVHRRSLERALRQPGKKTVPLEKKPGKEP